MQKLIDKKRFESRCEYCKNARIPEDRSIALCSRKGIVDIDDSCRHYKYDPLKRIPKKTRITHDFDESEFKL